MEKMRGARYNGLKDVTLGEFEKPVILPDTVLVRNITSGICGTDLSGYLYDGPAVGIHPGNQFGHEMCGEIVEVGEGVEGFNVGDIVFVNPGCSREVHVPEGWTAIMNCDMRGAFSEYVLVDKPQWNYNLFKIPDGIDPVLAALVEPMSVGVNGVVVTNPKKGEKAIIYGAGPIGLSALAGLKYLGIEEVIVADTLPSRLEVVEKMGGIPCDVNKHNVNEFAIERWGSHIGNLGQTTNDADIVIDCVGYKGAIRDYLDYAKINSRLSVVALGNAEETITGGEIVLRTANILAACAYTPEVINLVIEIISSGKIDVGAMITSTYPLSDVTNAFINAADKEKNIKVIIENRK